jgi:hypothetical protein
MQALQEAQLNRARTSCPAGYDSPNAIEAATATEAVVLSVPVVTTVAPDPHGRRTVVSRAATKGWETMRRQILTRWLGIFLGSIFLLFSVLETIRVFVSGDGGLLFWFGTLFGGGTLVLLGTLRLQSRPALSLCSVILGAFAGSLATAWTVVLPLLALLLIVMRVMGTSEVPGRDPVR